ncbi:MAG: T9SS type A sorting domain-containing protein, partial [candidate division WOR-3 bacterium]
IFLLKCPSLIKTNNIVFQVFSPHAQEARVKIMDITGKILDMKSVSLQNGPNELNLTLKIRNSGVYFIFVEARNISLSTKVVIVK